ncbi:MAG: aminoacyl-tRNA hydrolase [Patescibacteria group bacterium]
MLIVGLGNIGKEYEATRHNVGFKCVDEIQKSWQGTEWKEEKKWQCFISEVQKNGEKILLAKPTTFMNNSGIAIEALSKYYKMNPDEILVIYDDIDLPFGTTRLRKKGGPGTHNGMKSMVIQLGTENFPRIRIGIENRQNPIEIVDYVLGKWTKEEQKQLQEVIKKIPEICEEILKNSFEAAMNTYNGEQ